MVIGGDQAVCLQEDSDMSYALLVPGALDRASELLKALGHPVRLEVVLVLAERARRRLVDEQWGDEGELCVCRMSERFDLSAPALSHHLAALRHAGLVETRRDGARILYRLNEKAVEELRAVLGAIVEGEQEESGTFLG